MEVMKGGQIVEQRDISDRAFHRFGRGPTNEASPARVLSSPWSCDPLASSACTQAGQGSAQRCLDSRSFVAVLSTCML